MSQPTPSRLTTLYNIDQQPTGATYDSIEGRFRIIRTEAAALKAEVDSGERGEAPARGTTISTSRKPRSNLTTPKKDKTAGGRVSKSSNGTPSKKRGKAIKEEMDDMYVISITAPTTCLTRIAYSVDGAFANILSIEDETFPALDFEKSQAGAEGSDPTEFFSDTHFAVNRDLDSAVNASMDFEAF